MEMVLPSFISAKEVRKIAVVASGANWLVFDLDEVSDYLEPKSLSAMRNVWYEFSSEGRESRSGWSGRLISGTATCGSRKFWLHLVSFDLVRS